jgi:hypothetical protein
MACKCGCGENRMTQALIDKIEQLRTLVGMPISIDRGVSCVEHNAAVGGAADSEHLPIAYASDDVAAMPEEDFFTQAITIFHRVGLYFQNGLIHADMKVDANGNPIRLFWYRLNGKYTYFENPQTCLMQYKLLKAQQGE